MDRRTKLDRKFCDRENDVSDMDRLISYKTEGQSGEKSVNNIRQDAWRKATLDADFPSCLQYQKKRIT